MRSITGILTLCLVLGAGCGDDGGQNDNQNDNQNGNNVGICGDGVVDPGEQCDDGAQNSDTAPDACRSSCRRASCGDGVVDTGEQCDEAASNSDLLPDACRRDCQSATCGDGVTDSGEACDNGADNSDSEPGACRADCVLPACGDGVADPGLVCYAFWDVAWPYGFQTPVDVDGDGLVDLVGPASDDDRVYLHTHNEGTGLAYGRGHLVTPGSSMMALPGHLVSGATRPDLLVGASPPMVASVAADQRLTLPAALPVTIPESWMEDRVMVTGVVGPTGNRYVAWGIFDYDIANYCVAAVDATGLLVPESRSCQSLEPLRNEFVGYWNTAPQVLTTSAGTSVLAILNNGRENFDPSGVVSVIGLIHLDDQAQAVSAEVMELGWSSGYSTGPVWLGRARTDNADTYLVAYTSDSAMNQGRLEYRKWNPQTAVFDLSSASISIPDVWAANLMTGWHLSASSSWKDIAFVDQDEQLRVFAYDAASTQFTESVTCALPFDGVGSILSVDLDADQDEDLVVVGSDVVDSTWRWKVMVLWNTGQTIDCATNTTVIPHAGQESIFPSVVAHVDGDAYPDILFSTSSNLYGAEMLRGGPAPAFSKIALGAMARRVAALPAGNDTQDLVFSTYSGPGKAVVGLARMVSGDFETGKPLVTAGEDPFAGTARQLMVVDVDHDGHSDALFVTEDQTLHVYRGPYDEAAGGFAAHDTYQLPYQPGVALAVDLTGDGLPDLVTVRGNPLEPASSPDNLVTVIPNNGGGFATTPRQFETDFDPVLMVPGLFNDDNDVDLATVHATAGTVVVLLNDGAGGLVRSERKFIPGRPVTAAASDLDGDGHLDLSVATPESGMGPVWLRGRGDGTFEDAVDLNLTSGEFLAMGTMNTGSAVSDLLVVKQQNGEFITAMLEAVP